MGMDPVTASIVGPVVGSAVGGMLGKSTAKTDAAAQRYAADKSAEGFTLAKPYISAMYEQGQDALDASMAQGAYTGPTYASLNPTQMQGINYLTNFGQNAIGQGANLMNQGAAFGSNFQNIFNRASGPTLDNAIGYATSSPQAQSMIDAAMRDSRRRLDEQTMPGIGMSASNSGNTNSSRAGVAEALAQRAFDDREADVRAGVFNDLTNQYLRSNTQDLQNMTSANEGLKNAYGIGFGMGPQVANMLTQAGGALQSDSQNQMNDNMNSFERQRDFALDQVAKYNAGILNNSPQSANYQPITANPTMAGLSGAMAGFGFGGKLGDLFKTTPTTAAPSSYTPIDYTQANASYGLSGGRRYGVNNNPYGF